MVIKVKGLTLNAWAPGVAEMSTNAGGCGFPQLLQSVCQELWHFSHWCDTATTASTRFAGLFDLWNGVGFFLDDGLAIACASHASHQIKEINASENATMNNSVKTVHPDKA